MDNVKDDWYYVEKIKSDMAFVIAHTAGKTKDEIEADELLIDSVMFRIIQISENNSKLSDSFRNAHTEVPWLAIKGMRNRIVHAYGNVDLSIVYDTVTHGFPEMLQKLNGIKKHTDPAGTVRVCPTESHDSPAVCDSFGIQKSA